MSPSFKDLLRQRGNQAPTGQRERVLVIDDDPSIRDSLALELRRTYEVTLAESASQGIAAVSSRPAVILLDIKMRGEDGFFAYREIRKIDAVVPIIFHSAYQDLKDPYQVLNEYRPFGYITKGSDLAQLYRQLDQAIEYYHRHVTQKIELSDKLKKMSGEVDRLRALVASKENPDKK